MDNFAGQTQDGNAIIRHSSNGGTNQEWGLLALPAATSSSHFRYELVNPASSKCVGYTPPAVNLATCTDATQASVPSQSVEPIPAPSTGLYQLMTSTLGQMIGGPVAPVNGNEYDYIAATQPTQPDQLWGLNLAADSIWTAPSQLGGLHATFRLR